MKKGVFTVPRIAGLIIIIIGVLSWLSGRGGFGLLLAGFILIAAPKKYALRQWDLFTESFTKWKTIVITALYDSLFWLFLFGSGYFYLWRLRLKGEFIQSTTTLTKEAMLNPALAAQNADAVQGLVWFFIIGLSLLAIFNVLSYSFFRGLTWSTIADIKPSKRLFTRFLGLNVCWWLLWFVPFLLMAVAAVKDQGARVLLIAVLVIAAYFTPIVHVLFTKTPKIGYSLGHGIAWGIVRFYRFILPYTLAIVAYVIVFQLFRFFQYLPARSVQVVSMLFVVLYLAWLRVFLYPIILELPED